MAAFPQAQDPNEKTLQGFSLVLHGLVSCGSASCIRSFQFIFQFLEGILHSHSPHGVEWECSSSPARYLVWTLWAALPELAGRVWLKPLAVLSLSEYLDPKNISACYKKHQRTRQQPEPKVLPCEPKWNLSVPEPEQTFPGQGESHCYRFHFKQPPV